MMLFQSTRTTSGIICRKTKYRSLFFYSSIILTSAMTRKLLTPCTVTALPFRVIRGGGDDDGKKGEDEDNGNVASPSIHVATFTSDSTSTDSSSSSSTSSNIAFDDVFMQRHPYYYDDTIATTKGNTNNHRNRIVENFTQLYYDHFHRNSGNTSDNVALSKASMELRDDIRTKASGMKSLLVDIRRTLHRYPELMYEEQITSTIIQSILKQYLNISTYTTGWAKNIHTTRYPPNAVGGYGVVVDIGTGQEPCILLRADIDALPINEKTLHVDEYRSTHANKMHACGHDGHTTMLLGAISILKSMEESIPGTIRCIFQPAEEGGAGAKRMIEEGVLEHHPKPSYAFGMHVWPTLESGVIATKSGPIMAACERFEIIIHGVGGHAAMPHLTIDPIVTASAIIMNLQTIVSRNTNPLEAAVCTITQFHSGSGAYNIIPEASILKGTIRSLSTDTLLELRDKVQHIVTTTADTYGCNVTIEYSPDYYPVTINDPWLTNHISKDVASLVADNGAVHDTIVPTMGAEDFSFITQQIPSTFFFLGQGSSTDPVPTNYGLHHPHFALDESILSKGVELHVNLALRSLIQLSSSNKQTIVDRE